MKYSLGLFAIALCMFSAGYRRSSSFREPIQKVVQSGASQLNVSNVTNFAWEDVFVFGPYTPKKEECQTLKHSESQCSYEGLRDVDEGEFLMVFLHNASVIRIESLPRTVADFDDRCLNRDFKRDAAVFFVEKRTTMYLTCR